MPDPVPMPVQDVLTEDEALLLKTYRELKADPDLQLPFIADCSAGFTTTDRFRVNLTLSINRNL